MKKIAVVILSLFIVACVVCCVLTLVGSPENLQVNDPAPSEKSDGLVKSVAYCYNAEVDGNPTENLPWNVIGYLGTDFAPGMFFPEPPEIDEWSRRLSGDENQEPGWELLCSIEENLDKDKYIGPFETYEDGMRVTTYYRVFGGVTTDEQLRIWHNGGGEVLKFQKRNWGKYDAMSRWEGRIASEYNLLLTQAGKAMAKGGDYTLKDVVPDYTGSLFTDTDGKLVLKTTGCCQDGASGKAYYVQFYGAITPN